jgi:chloramphenicol O-acetyltransferase
MRLSADGLVRVKEMTAFFSALKRDERLSEAQASVLEGFALFLRNSRHSVEERTDIKVDTNEAPVFENNSFWQGLPWVR